MSRTTALIPFMPQDVCRIVHEYDNPDAHFRIDLLTTLGGLPAAKRIMPRLVRLSGIREIFVAAHSISMITRDPFTGRERTYTIQTSPELNNIYAGFVRPVEWRSEGVDGCAAWNARQRVVWKYDGELLRAAPLDFY